MLLREKTGESRTVESRGSAARCSFRRVEKMRENQGPVGVEHLGLHSTTSGSFLLAFKASICGES